MRFKREGAFLYNKHRYTYTREQYGYTYLAWYRYGSSSKHVVDQKYVFGLEVGMYQM